MPTSLVISDGLRRQRLDSDDGIAVLVSEPKARESAGFLHLNVANVGFMRQHILGEFSSLGIQRDSNIVVHSGRPDIRLVIELRVVRPAPLGGNLPLGDL